MKKIITLTAIIATLAFGLAACDDEGTPATNGADAAPAVAGEDVPIGGPFVVPEGGIPVEDEAAADDASGDKDAGSKEKNSTGSGDDTVKILKSSNTFGKVILGEHYKVTVKAKGKDVAMSASGLPPGLEASSPPTSSKTLNIEGVPTELGEFAITIEAHSTSDPANKAEKQFTMKVMEDLVLNVYQLKLDDSNKWTWAKVENFNNSLTIPYGQVLRLEARSKSEDEDVDPPADSEGSQDEGLADANPGQEDAEGSDAEADDTGKAKPKVTGNEVVEDDGTKSANADKYFWSIDEQECTEDDCKDKDIILTATDPYTETKSPNDSIRYLTVDANFTTDKVENIIIKVKNLIGDEDSVSLVSMVFEKDPCSLPLTISGKSSDIATEAVFGKKQSASLQAAGGLAPYSWKILVKTNSDSVANNETELNGSTIKGNASGQLNASPTTYDTKWDFKCSDGSSQNCSIVNLSSEFKYGPSPGGDFKETIGIALSDSCANRKPTFHTIKYHVKYPSIEDEKLSDLTLFLAFESEWTNEDTEMRVTVVDDSKEAILVTDKLELDTQGDPGCHKYAWPLTVEDSKRKLTDIAQYKVYMDDDNGSWYTLGFTTDLEIDWDYAVIAGKFWYKYSGKSHDWEVDDNDMTRYTGAKEEWLPRCYPNDPDRLAGCENDGKKYDLDGSDTCNGG